ncbi:MAG TPA: histidine kinase, partial [Herpetosiphonaceae bacterium]|nr:histidine kinase [Herpetosiphonaceae bacterium]
MAMSTSPPRSRPLLLPSRAVQVGWMLFALFAVSLALPGIAAYHRLLQMDCEGSGCLPTQLTPEEARAVLVARSTLADYAGLEVAVYLCAAILLVTAAAAFIWRKPADRTATLGAFLMVALATRTLAEASAQSMPALQVPARLLQAVEVAGLLPFFCLIPDGRFRPAWLRWAALAMAPLGLLTAFDVLDLRSRMVLGVVMGVLIALSLLHRYHALTGSPRQEQVIWAVAAFALLIGAQWVGRPLRPLPLPAVPLTALPPESISFFSVIGMLFLVGAVMCLTVALLNEELFRVEVALNRALVYSMLTLFVVAVYVLVVGYLSLVFQSRGSVWFSLVATGLVAVLFQPVQARVQRFVNELLYGKRDDPYGVLVGLGRRLEAAFEPSTLLPAIVQTVRESLGLPYVAITLHQPPAVPLVVADGQAPAEPVRFPLVYGGETLGELRVSPRRGETTLAPADRRLLADLAQQAGLAVHGVHLMAELRRMTTDLQHSRERLVLAREEERRRIRRDLHDDLAPTLAGLAFKARTISDLLPADPARAALLAHGLHEAIRDTVGNIRRLVHDLRPPALDELGLLAAIRERAALFGEGRGDGHVLRVMVEAPSMLPALPAAVEVAAYRTVQEGLMNVARHARAETCHVRILLAGTLQIEITDDGVGCAPGSSPGIGLPS